MRNTFVIWDSQTIGIRLMLEELCRSGSALGVNWQIPGIGTWPTLPGAQQIYDAIRAADHLLAVIDEPALHIAWEVGLALGWRKSVRLATVSKELPAWAGYGALRGIRPDPISSMDDIAALLAPVEWNYGRPREPISEETGAILLLGAEGPDGSALRRMALRAVTSLKLLDEDGWGLNDVPALLDDVAQVVWVLSALPVGAEPEMAARSAADAVVAGMACGFGRPVRVLRSSQARPIANLRPYERQFQNGEEFVRAIQGLLTAPSSWACTANHPQLFAPRLADIILGRWLVRPLGASDRKERSLELELTATPERRFSARTPMDDSQAAEFEGTWRIHPQQLTLLPRDESYELPVRFLQIKAHELKARDGNGNLLLWQRL